MVLYHECANLGNSRTIVQNGVNINKLFLSGCKNRKLSPVLHWEAFAGRLLRMGYGWVK